MLFWRRFAPARCASFTSSWRPKWRRDCALSLYCTVLSVLSTWKLNELTSVGNKTVKYSMPNLKASRSEVIAAAFFSTRPPSETFSKEPYSSRNHSIQAAAPSPLPLSGPIERQQFEILSKNFMSPSERLKCLALWILLCILLRLWRCLSGHSKKSQYTL